MLIKLWKIYHGPARPYFLQTNEKKTSKCSKQDPIPTLVVLLYFNSRCRLMFIITIGLWSKVPMLSMYFCPILRPAIDSIFWNISINQYIFVFPSYLIILSYFLMFLINSMYVLRHLTLVTTAVVWVYSVRKSYHVVVSEPHFKMTTLTSTRWS